MWLLDANMDVHLLPILREFGISGDSAIRLGWGHLHNGELVATAVAAGFTCLLTKDRLFGESAMVTLNKNPQVSVVVLDLLQKPWREYCDQFRLNWAVSPIQPVPGRVIHWPIGVHGPR